MALKTRTVQYWNGEAQTPLTKHQLDRVLAHLENASGGEGNGSGNGGGNSSTTSDPRVEQMWSTFNDFISNAGDCWHSEAPYLIKNSDALRDLIVLQNSYSKSGTLWYVACWYYNSSREADALTGWWKKYSDSLLDIACWYASNTSQAQALTRWWRQYSGYYNKVPTIGEGGTDSRVDTLWDVYSGLKGFSVGYFSGVTNWSYVGLAFSGGNAQFLAELTSVQKFNNKLSCWWNDWSGPAKRIMPWWSEYSGNLQSVACWWRDYSGDVSNILGWWSSNSSSAKDVANWWNGNSYDAQQVLQWWSHYSGYYNKVPSEGSGSFSGHALTDKEYSMFMFAFSGMDNVCFSYEGYLRDIFTWWHDNSGSVPPSSGPSGVIPDDVIESLYHFWSGYGVPYYSAGGLPQADYSRSDVQSSLAGIMYWWKSQYSNYWSGGTPTTGGANYEFLSMEVSTLREIASSFMNEFGEGSTYSASNLLAKMVSYVGNMHYYSQGAGAEVSGFSGMVSFWDEYGVDLADWWSSNRGSGYDSAISNWWNEWSGAFSDNNPSVSIFGFDVTPYSDPHRDNPIYDVLITNSGIFTKDELLRSNIIAAQFCNHIGRSGSTSRSFSQYSNFDWSGSYHVSKQVSAILNGNEDKLQKLLDGGGLTIYSGINKFINAWYSCDFIGIGNGISTYNGYAPYGGVILNASGDLDFSGSGAFYPVVLGAHNSVTTGNGDFNATTVIGSKNTVRQWSDARHPDTSIVIGHYNTYIPQAPSGSLVMPASIEGIIIGNNNLVSRIGHNSTIIGNNVRIGTYSDRDSTGTLFDSLIIGSNMTLCPDHFGTSIIVLGDHTDYSSAENYPVHRSALFFMREGSPMANQWEGGEAAIGYMEACYTWSSSYKMWKYNGVIRSGTQKVSALFPNNAGEYIFDWNGRENNSDPISFYTYSGAMNRKPCYINT